MKNFVILIPSFNDWDNLNILIPKIHNILKNNDMNFSIIIINDASTIKNNLSFKSQLCFEKIEVLNLIKNIKAQKAITTALYYLKSKNYDGGIVIMDADGQDDPETLPQIIDHAKKNPEKVLTVNRTKRNEGLLFKIFYELHLFITFLFTFKNLRFGVYSYMHPTHLNKILSNKDLCSAFAGAVAKNFKDRKTIFSERKKRLLGESKNSYLNLIYYSLSILSVFKYRVLLHSTILILIFFLLSSFKIFLILFWISVVALSFFNILIFLINDKNNKFNVENCLNNIKDFTNGSSGI
tara:strand:- start:1617 stop:2501 length:885 start_codon:yes stop_codon:yes gene_type:complete